MIKARLKGDAYELKHYLKDLRKDKGKRIISVSEILPMKGTNRYKRLFVDFEYVNRK